MTRLTVFDASASVFKTSVRQPVTITVPSDGANQTAYIAAQLAAIADGGSAIDRQVIILRNADPIAGSRVDGVFTLASRNHLIIQAPPAETFFMWTTLTGQQAGLVDGSGNSTRQHVLISACNDITLRRFYVQGPNTAREVSDARFAQYQEVRAFEHAFGVQGASTGITIENCGSTNTFGDALYVGGTGNPNVGVTVRNHVATFTGRQSIGLVNGTNVSFTDVSVIGGGRSGLDIEPNHDTHHVTDVSFTRVTMGSRFYPFIAGGDAGDAAQHLHGTFTWTDCVGLNASSGHTAIFLDSAGDDAIITGHTDLRNRSPYCVHNQATWDSVTVEDCNISSGPAADTTYGLFAGAIHGSTIPTTLPATVTTGSSTILCPGVVASDAGRQCYGRGVPSKPSGGGFIKVGEVTPGVSFTMRRSDNNALFPATDSNTAIVIVRLDPLVGQPAFNGTPQITMRNNTFNGPAGQAVGVGGADELYLVGGSTTVTHCGNVWNMGASNDGAC